MSQTSQGPCVSSLLCLLQKCRIFTRYSLLSPISITQATGRAWSCSQQSRANSALPCNMSNKERVHSMPTSAGPLGGSFGISQTQVQLPSLELLHDNTDPSSRMQGYHKSVTTVVLCSQLSENTGWRTRGTAEVATLTIIPKDLLAENCVSLLPL